MLSIKEKRVCLAFAVKPTITYKELGKTLGISPNKVSRTLKSSEGMEYVESLQKDLVGRTMATQAKQLKKLKKVYKKSMKVKTDAQGNKVPVNLPSAVSAVAAIATMTGTDKQVRKPLTLDLVNVDKDDPLYLEKIVSQLLQGYANREIDKTDFEVLLKGIELVAAIGLSTKLHDKLSQLGIKTNLEVFS